MLYKNKSNNIWKYVIILKGAKQEKRYVNLFINKHKRYKKVLNNWNKNFKSLKMDWSMSNKIKMKKEVNYYQ